MAGRWFFAAVHLLALGIGLGAVWGRARALRGRLDAGGLRRVFYADVWWGVAALLLIGSGLVRLFGAHEKATEYYLRNDLFWTKMGLLVAILLLEIAPMSGLIRWRVRGSRGVHPDTSAAAWFAVISYVQAGLVVLMLLAATAMARGHGVPSR